MPAAPQVIDSSVPDKVKSAQTDLVMLAEILEMSGWQCPAVEPVKQDNASSQLDRAACYWRWNRKSTTDCPAFPTFRNDHEPVLRTADAYFRTTIPQLQSPHLLHDSPQTFGLTSFRHHDQGSFSKVDTLPGERAARLPSRAVAAVTTRAAAALKLGTKSRPSLADAGVLPQYHLEEVETAAPRRFRISNDSADAELFR